MTNTRDSVKASIFMALGVFSFSTTEALVKLLGNQISTSEFLFWRGVFVVPVLGYLWLKGYTKGFQSSLPLFHIFRSVGGMIAIICTIISLKHLDLVEFTFIFFTTPLMGTVLSWLVLKEPFHKEGLISLLVGFAGVFIILYPNLKEPSGSLIGYGAAALGALIYAAGILAGKKVALKDDPLVYLYFYTAVCIIYGFIGMESFDTSYHIVLGQNATSFLLALLLILAGVNLCANLFINAALRLEKTQKLFPFEYLSLLFAIVWSWVLWHKLPEPHTLLGGALIFLAVGILMIPSLWERLGVKLR